LLALAFAWQCAEVWEEVSTALHVNPGVIASGWEVDGVSPDTAVQVTQVLVEGEISTEDNDVEHIRIREEVHILEVVAEMPVAAEVGNKAIEYIERSTHFRNWI